MKAIYCLVFVIIIASFSVAESGTRSQGLKQNYQQDRQGSYYSNAQSKYYKTNQKLEKTASSRKLDVSPTQKMNVTAWGIIGIILGVIIFSTITYYVFILYPYICKKQNSYDIMELTDVNSVSTVSDNANVPLYRCQNDISNDIPVNH